MNQYLHHTTAWIKDFVIQYQLCPFAAQPFQEDRIKYVLFEGSDVEALVEKTFLEALQLKEIDPKEVETTLIIHPIALIDFEDYISTVEQMQEDLEKIGLEGVVQLASFHPDYQFAETQRDDPENFTNRSPYPMIHLLREESVEKVITLYPDTENIPVENIKTMNKLGRVQLIHKRNEIIGKN